MSLNKKRNMVQCCICSTVFTKDGKPNRFFNIDDKTIYGCTQCKKGIWQSHSRTTLNGLKVSTVKYKNKLGIIEKIDDTGYLDYDRDRTGLIQGLKREFLV